MPGVEEADFSASNCFQNGVLWGVLRLAVVLAAYEGKQPAAQPPGPEEVLSMP